MFCFPATHGLGINDLVRDPLSPADLAVQKEVGAKLVKNDVAGANAAAQQIFDTYGRNVAFKEIFNHSFAKGDFAEAERALGNMSSFFDGGEHDECLKKIVDCHLEKNDFVKAIKTCGISLSRSQVEKVAEKIKAAELDETALQEIEAAALDAFPIFSFHSFFSLFSNLIAALKSF